MCSSWSKRPAAAQASATEHPPLGELLAREGALSREAVATLLRRMVETPSLRAGEILIAERLANEALIGAALRWQLRSRLETVFRLADGQVRFHVRRPPRRASSALLTPRDFLHGRRRARADGGSRATGHVREQAQREAAFRVLGVDPGTDPTLVRQAYRRLAAVHHPDRHPQATAEELRDLVQKFTRISAAYQVIARA